VWCGGDAQIPFKGTGKEYIGDDIEEMRKSVKAAIMRCCKQLKNHLLTRDSKRCAWARVQSRYTAVWEGPYACTHATPRGCAGSRRSARRACCATRLM
jgi:hypothetical protein